jgi:hypothetical protein
MGPIVGWGVEPGAVVVVVVDDPVGFLGEVVVGEPDAVAPAFVVVVCEGTVVVLDLWCLCVDALGWLEQPAATAPTATIKSNLEHFPGIGPPESLIESDRGRRVARRWP